MLHDPIVFSRPDKFIPERYLKDGKPDEDAADPARISFGFGRRCVICPVVSGSPSHLSRRICPGRHFADSSLFINIASVLHTLDISLPLDEYSRPIRIEPRASTGIVSSVGFIQQRVCMIRTELNFPVSLRIVDAPSSRGRRLRRC